jgi:hypothetical protein
LYGDFAYSFERVEKALRTYMAAHGAALVRHDKAFDGLSEAIAQAEIGKFEVSRDSISDKGYEIAGKVIKELEEVENALCKAVWSQTGR